MLEIPDVRQLRDRVGQEIAVSDWVVIEQERINLFADATGDHQWIHVDPARAAAESPYAAPIAHGFLTLSLVSALTRNAMSIGGLRMAVNYGLNRVRFVSAVPAGARIRARLTPSAVEAVRDGVQVTWAITIELERADKPACVIEWLVRYYPDLPPEGGSHTP